LRINISLLQDKEQNIKEISYEMILTGDGLISVDSLREKDKVIHGYFRLLPTIKTLINHYLNTFEIKYPFHLLF